MKILYNMETEAKNKELKVMKDKNPNVKKWIVLVSIMIITIIGSGALNIILNNSNKTALASADDDELSIENFTAVENKTEEELKEINDKEVKEAEQNEKSKEKDTSNKSTTKNNNSSKTKNKYYIKVNYGAQVVTVYTYDSKGNYSVPVKAMVCSTGTETPRSGVYKIPAKILWCKMYGDVYAHYCSQIVGNILFHSVPFLEKNNHTLEYWEYDKLGTKASMGCIRLTTRDAKWLFDNVSVGTSVEFYSSSNPGPLGKPTAPKISSAPKNLRGWDPTDPDPNNPWKNYNPNKEDNDKNENTNTEAPSVDSTNTTNNQNSENNANNENSQNTGSNTNNQNNQSTGTNTNNENNQVNGNNTNNENNQVNENNTNNENNQVNGNNTNNENNQNNVNNTNTENNQSSGNTNNENINN